MKQEDKELLLKDLCARLPYDLQVKIVEDDEPYTLLSAHPNKDIALIGIDMGGVYATSKVKIDTIKPYLRPMSSMTDEELFEAQDIIGKGVEIRDIFISIVDSSINSFTYLELQAVFEWLLKNHFDFMGLIPKNLAIEVTENNNPYV